MKCLIPECKQPLWYPHHHHPSYFNPGETSLFPCICTTPGGEETTVAPPKFVKTYPRALVRRDRYDSPRWEMALVWHEPHDECCIHNIMTTNGAGVQALYEEAHIRVRRAREEAEFDKE